MEGNCEEIMLSGPLDRIRASDSDTGKGLSGIRFYRGRKAKTFGVVEDQGDYREWYFPSSKPLIGYFGSQSITEEIEKLGFITFDS